MTEKAAGAQPTSDSAAAAATAAAGTPAAAAGEKPAAAAATADGTKTGEQLAAAAEGQKPGEKPAEPVKIALTVPDGATTFVDEGDLKEFEAIAKREGWSNDDAQAFLNEQVGLRKGMFDKFLTEAKAHSEIGGEHLEAAQKNARVFMDHFLPANTPDGEALRRGLTKLGLANYPPLVVLFARAGKAMGEDAPASGLSGGKTEVTAEQKLYGKPAKAS